MTLAVPVVLRDGRGRPRWLLAHPDDVTNVLERVPGSVFREALEAAWADVGEPAPAITGAQVRARIVGITVRDRSPGESLLLATDAAERRGAPTSPPLQLPSREPPQRFARCPAALGPGAADERALAPGGVADVFEIGDAARGARTAATRSDAGRARVRTGADATSLTTWPDA